MKKRMFAVSALLMAAAIAGTSSASSATVMCAYAETADEDKVELPDRDIDDVDGTLESITAEYTGNGLSSENPKPSKDDLIVKGQYTVTPSSGEPYTRTETITDYTYIRYILHGVTGGGVMQTRDGRTVMTTIWIITARDKNTGKDVSCNIQIPYVIQSARLVSDDTEDKDSKKADSDDKTEEIVDTEDTDEKPEDGSGKTVSGLDGNDSKSTSSDDDEEIIDAEEDSPDSSKEDTSKDKKEESVIKKDKKKSRKVVKKPSKKKRTKKNSKRKNKAARKRLSTKKKSIKR